MKKTIILALSMFALGGLVSPAQADAQAFRDGYGTEVGKVIVILVPEDADITGRFTVVQTTSNVTGTKSVGNCDRNAQLGVRAGTIVDRSGEKDSVEAEFVVLHPQDLTIPDGLLLGAFRESGPCGPGWRILRAHVLDPSS